VYTCAGGQPMSANSRGYYIGVDLGTQGVRCVALDDAGQLVGRADRPLPPPPRPRAGRSEQDPRTWWETCRLCLGELTGGLPAGRVAAVCVDSTSGTFVATDEHGRPLGRAVMYNDERASAEAEDVAAVAAGFTQRLGYGFPPTFALPKMLWVARHRPRVWRAAHKMLHAADLLVAALTGEARFSDWSNSLKTGYDLLERRWPDFLSQLGLDVGKLPEVVAPGTPVGEVSHHAAEETGLPAGAAVIAGCTDGTASLLASGVSRPGEWNSTLGTTLAIRGVSDRLISDPVGRIYCHLHPDGLWLPGGASNTGARPIAERFGEATLRGEAADAVAAAPYDALVYPLSGKGERMPFASAEAEGFVVANEGTSEGDAGLGAWLQGQALAERWCFELCRELGAPVGEWIAVTGGAAQNEAWLRLRADVLGRQLRRPQHAYAAYGVALLAMAGARREKVSDLGRDLIRFDLTVDPNPSRGEIYAQLLERLREQVRARGWS